MFTCQLISFWFHNEEPVFDHFLWGFSLICWPASGAWWISWNSWAPCGPGKAPRRRPAKTTTEAPARQRRIRARCWCSVGATARSSDVVGKIQEFEVVRIGLMQVSACILVTSMSKPEVGIDLTRFSHRLWYRLLLPTLGLACGFALCQKAQTRNSDHKQPSSWMRWNIRDFLRAAPSKNCWKIWVATTTLPNMFVDASG